jgi:magnesium-protoporphyrin IX monomethyl ester (oxidative) cyclase
VFPVSLDTDAPAFRAGLASLVQARLRFDAGRARGGVVGRLQQVAAALSGGATFLKLYFFPVKRHDLPEQIRVAPVW